MTYIEIYILRGAEITSTINFKSTEKANAFFKTLMEEDSEMTTYSDTHKTIKQKGKRYSKSEGPGAVMRLKTISFQDE